MLVTRPTLWLPWQKPDWPLEINREHPLAAGLIALFAFVPGGGSLVYDLCSKGNHLLRSPAGNPPQWVAGERGGAMEFVRTVSQYAEIDVATVGGYPLTLACLFWLTSNPGDQALVVIADKDTSNHFHQLLSRSASVGYRASAGGSIGLATTTVAPSLNTWHHACAVGVSSTDRAVFLDAGNKGTSTASVDPANLDRTSVARRGISGADHYLDGRVTGVWIWNRALSDQEVFGHYSDPWGMLRPPGPWVALMPGAGAAFATKVPWHLFQGSYLGQGAA